MAGASLLALLDDISTILDDVALMSKMAAKKTAGVLGDDLALNAQQVSGVNADRELPVVWAVARGSLRNKAILVPAALAISAFIPWAVTPLLMVGGAFLCFEGFEKLAHKWLARHEPAHDMPASVEPEPPPATLENDKIKGAVRTDFILSAEIIVIALGTVSHAPFGEQVAVLVLIALLMTVGVYGLVAAIVKLDDAGLHLSQKTSPVWRALGGGILQTAPYLMKTLSVVGTIAMFLVGGGILAHGLPGVHHWLATVLPATGGFVALVLENLFNALIGLLAGALVLAVVTGVKRVMGR